MHKLGCKKKAAQGRCAAFFDHFGQSSFVAAQLRLVASCTAPGQLLLRGFLESVGLVGELPGDVLVVDLAEVTVVGRLRVDRTEKVELLDACPRCRLIPPYAHWKKPPCCS